MVKIKLDHAGIEPRSHLIIIRHLNHYYVLTRSNLSYIVKNWDNSQFRNLGKFLEMPRKLDLGKTLG